MHTKTVKKAEFEADYLAWLKRRLARGNLPPHTVTLYTSTVQRLERQL